MLHRVLSICFVVLTLTVWASAPAVADMHQGKVVEVGAGKLTMMDMAGKNQHSHEVATDAAITCEGKTCGLTDVKGPEPSRTSTVRTSTDTDRFTRKEGMMCVSTETSERGYRGFSPLGPAKSYTIPFLAPKRPKLVAGSR